MYKYLYSYEEKYVLVDFGVSYLFKGAEQLLVKSLLQKTHSEALFIIANNYKIK